jgi:arylsulfatase
MSSGSKPNIIIIMTDQQRWDTLGLYGNSVIHTPVLDALGQEGVLFSHCFTPIPLCVPSRTTLFTGRYPHVHGIRGHHGIGYLSDDEPTLFEIYQQAGYQVGLIGKNHLLPPHRLHRLNFVDEFDHAGKVGQMDAWRTFREQLFYCKYGNGTDYPLADSLTRQITCSAIEWIAHVSQQPSPFFVLVSYPDPHPPYVVPEPFNTLYHPEELPQPVGGGRELENKPFRQSIARYLMHIDDYSAYDMQRLKAIYYGMISHIDTEIGQLIETIKKRGISRNTIVLFTSDHGDYLGDHGMIRKSPAMYDCLIRVPALMWGPEYIKSGTMVTDLVESVDWAPTLLSLCNLDRVAGMQGQSLVPYFSGQSPPSKPAVYGTYGLEGQALTPQDWEQIDFDFVHRYPQQYNWLSLMPMRGRFAMVRTLAWKYVHYRNGEQELYDLIHDPHELTNLAQDPAYNAHIKEMKDRLLDWLIDTQESRPPYRGEIPFRGRNYDPPQYGWNIM